MLVIDLDGRIGFKVGQESGEVVQTGDADVVDTFLVAVVVDNDTLDDDNVAVDDFPLVKDMVAEDDTVDDAVVNVAVVDDCVVGDWIADNVAVDDNDDAGADEAVT